MPWEARPGGRYYYRAKKFKGRVIKEYVGAGPSAEAAAAEDALARKTRDAARQLTNERLSALEQQWAIPLEEFNQTSTICDALVAGALLAEDFHQHDRGAWRKRRMTSSKRAAPAPGMIASLFSGPELSPDNVDEVLCILLRRARNGDDGAAEYLAGLSQQASPLWDLLTGLVRTAKASWIALVTLPGEDRALDREGLERQLVHLQRELAAEGCSRLELLLIQHILIAWMAVNHADIQLADAVRGERTTREHDYLQRQLERTQRNLLRATQSLATLRRLRPTAISSNAARQPVNAGG